MTDNRSRESLRGGRVVGERINLRESIRLLEVDSPHAAVLNGLNRSVNNIA
jgi:hypothetical protein